MLLNATKYQGYSFYRSQLLRENQQVEGGGGVREFITDTSVGGIYFFVKLNKSTFPQIFFKDLVRSENEYTTDWVLLIIVSYNSWNV